MLKGVYTSDICPRVLCAAGLSVHIELRVGDGLPQGMATRPRGHSSTDHVGVRPLG